MRPDLIAQRVGGGTALPGIPTVPLPVENHFVELFRGSDGIVQQLVKSGLFNLRKIGHHLFGEFADTIVFGYASAGFPVIGAGEIRVGVSFPPVFVGRPLVSPSHQFGFALKGQVVERRGDFAESVVILAAENPTERPGLIIGRIRVVEPVDVVCHSQKKVYGRFAGLDVAGIQQPDAVGCGVIGFAELFVHQRRRG